MPDKTVDALFPLYTVRVSAKSLWEHRFRDFVKQLVVVLNSCQVRVDLLSLVDGCAMKIGSS